MTIEKKWEQLLSLLREMKLAVIAFSGGVDSSLLLAAASEAMGPNLIAVTAVSETYPPGELVHAREFARTLGVRHRVLPTHELANGSFLLTTPDRCYHCKKELFAKLRHIAELEGIAFILDGSNRDDLADHRPGRRAAEEFSVRSPLVEAGLTKAEVRELARVRNLPVWDKPSLACLSSRIPYGTRITQELLRTIHAAENVLHAKGFRQVRVRHHGETARIEIEREEFGKLFSDGSLPEIISSIKELGYRYVCLDLEGYRTRSMNEMIQETGVRRQESEVGTS